MTNGAKAPQSLTEDVIAAIEAVRSIDAPIGPTTTLSSLGVAGLVAETLAGPFQRIARAFKPDAVVGRSQCANLNTVADAIALVTKAAGF